MNYGKLTHDPHFISYLLVLSAIRFSKWSKLKASSFVHHLSRLTVSFASYSPVLSSTLQYSPVLFDTSFRS